MRDRIVSAKRAGREEEASKAASDSAAAAEAAAAAAAGKRCLGSPGAAQGGTIPLFDTMLWFDQSPLANDLSPKRAERAEGIRFPEGSFVLDKHVGTADGQSKAYLRRGVEALPPFSTVFQLVDKER